MTDVKLGFVPFAGPGKDVLVVFCDDHLEMGTASSKAIAGSGDLFQRVAKAERFIGKRGSTLVVPAPQGLPVSRLIVVGTGAPEKLEPNDVVNLGGTALGKVPSSARSVTIFAELAGKKSLTAEQAADLALGARLRAYSFDIYKTKTKDGDEKPAAKVISVAVADVGAARKAYAAREAVAEGVVVARDLVNEPANVFTRRNSRAVRLK
jgi:leucyl aminopeptidase